MIKALKAYYRKQQFNPGIAGLFVNPFFLARRRLWQAVHATAPMLQGRLLDVGCCSAARVKVFGEVVEEE